jgi:AraC-like DNA-binding protein
MHVETFHYQKGHRTPWHQHPSGQFYWLQRGILIIEMADVQWTVTPGTFGWFPGESRHCAQVPGEVAGKSLYLDAEHAKHFPMQAGIYSANPFVDGLLERACPGGQALSSEYLQSLLIVLGVEIARTSPLPLRLMLPIDRRARNVADVLLAQPDALQDQAELAQQWGMSVRTLSRLFREQTGLSFSQWRQQAKVVTSLQWVQAGLPISDIATRSGYSNISAYIEAFKGRFGVTPGQFQVNLRHQDGAM